MNTMIRGNRRYRKDKSESSRVEKYKSEIKSTMEVINTTLDTAEEKTSSELKNITIDSIQIETQKQK